MRRTGSRRHEESTRAKVIADITRTLGFDDVSYPGDPVFRRETIASTGVVDYVLSQISLGTHSGTHLDAPAHVIPGAKTLDQYPPDRFLLDAIVINCGDAPSVDVELLHDVPERHAVLFRTNNQHLSRDRCADSWVGLTKEAAHALVDLHVPLVGIDYLSIDESHAHELPVHHILLGNDVLILEEVNLADIDTGLYRLICLPLRIRDTDASPCRALLTGQRDD
jgi:arylformamidase